MGAWRDCFLPDFSCALLLFALPVKKEFPFVGKSHWGDTFFLRRRGVPVGSAYFVIRAFEARKKGFFSGGIDFFLGVAIISTFGRDSAGDEVPGLYTPTGRHYS